MLYEQMKRLAELNKGKGTWATGKLDALLMNRRLIIVMDQETNEDGCPLPTRVAITFKGQHLLRQPESVALLQAGAVLEQIGD